MEEDTRNLVDEYKGMENEQVFDALSKKRNSLEVAVENVSHDFNVGTIVRSANNFNVSKVHIIGKKKYNRRGAMCTDKYIEILHWESLADFLKDQRERKREIVAIENNTERVLPLSRGKLPNNATLVFGSEGDGISRELLEEADEVLEIESFGSTRSVNVGVAAGIAMYEWVRRNVLGRAGKE